MNKIFFFILCFQSVFSQSTLKGKIITDGNPDGILIVNYTTKATAITENGGFFVIEAQVNDKLVVSSNFIHGVELKLDKFSFQKELLYIYVKPRANQLEEIQIKSISAKSTGIVPKNIKEYTPAERKLRTAGELKWYSPLLIPFGGMSVDAVINKVSGRTSMLKKELQVERKEKMIEKFDTMFNESFYSNALQIPKENIKGFQLYCLDFPKFIDAVVANNKFLATVLAQDIANQYKTLILPENK